MKVLVIGGGGREHSICWSLSKSVTKLYCSPGNAGISELAECIDLEFHEIVNFSKDNEIDFVVVGPEVPLVNGIVDDLNDANIKAFGPTKDGARLESSKSFMKKICSENNIPTAEYRVFTDSDLAKRYVWQTGVPSVIKADGLAAGKGVIIAQTMVEAEKAIDNILAGYDKLIVEEFLDGKEVSLFVLADGNTILPLTTAQDYKKIYDGNNGPNTGGMGAYSPIEFLTNNEKQEILESIIVPTVEGLKKRGIDYKGVLYAGLMITENGPKLLEYNIRFGDPECQVILPRLETDFLELLMACSDGKLDEIEVLWKDMTAVTVVLANHGYPGEFDNGSAIIGIDQANENENVVVFHAGTMLDGDDVIAKGGRVLNVTAIDRNMENAAKNAYAAAELIYWPEKYNRKDIGESKIT